MKKTSKLDLSKKIVEKICDLPYPALDVAECMMALGILQLKHHGIKEDEIQSVCNHYFDVSLTLPKKRVN